MSSIGYRYRSGEREYFLWGESPGMSEGLRHRGEHARYEVSLFRMLGEVNWWPQIIDLLMQHKRACDEVRAELREQISQRIRTEELTRGVVWSDDERSDLFKMTRQFYEQ